MLDPRWHGRFGKAQNLYLLVAVYFVVAAAAFNGFYSKWGLRDATWNPEEHRYSIDAILDGTGYRPFVYRQLIPFIANRADALLPDSIRKERLANEYDAHGRLWSHLSGSIAPDPRYTIRYHMVYYLSFALSFLALFAMRAFCLAAGCDAVSATIAPAVRRSSFRYS